MSHKVEGTVGMEYITDLGAVLGLDHRHRIEDEVSGVDKLFLDV